MSAELECRMPGAAAGCFACCWFRHSSLLIRPSRRRASGSSLSPNKPPSFPASLHRRPLAPTRARVSHLLAGPRHRRGADTDEMEPATWMEGRSAHLPGAGADADVPDQSPGIRSRRHAAYRDHAARRPDSRWRRHLTGTASWMCCGSSCHPGSKELSLTLPVAKTTALNEKWHKLLNEERARAEQPSDAWSATASEKDNVITLHLKPASGKARLKQEPARGRKDHRIYRGWLVRHRQAANHRASRRREPDHHAEEA